MANSKSDKQKTFVVTAIYTMLGAQRFRVTQIFVTEALDRADAEMRVRDAIVQKRRGVVFETCEAQPIDLSGAPVEVYGGTVGQSLV